MDVTKITSQQIEALIAKHGLNLNQEGVVLVGIRQKPGLNKVGVWDDAFAWAHKGSIRAFAGNTDPSREFPHVANLKPGAWKYQKGIHHGLSGAFPPYPAYIQAGDVTVLRYIDGHNWNPDTGEFGIHIHHGGTGTSSLGCQTVPIANWPDFKAHGDALILQYNKKEFTYLLVENDGEFV